MTTTEKTTILLPVKEEPKAQLKPQDQYLMDLIQTKLDQKHEINIEDYAQQVKIKKKIFFEEFIEPLDHVIDLSEEDMRIISAACFLNSLTISQKQKLLNPKSQQYLYLPQELLSELDPLQHGLLS